LKKILQNLDRIFKQQQLIKANARIIVCVSGGCDSIALLHLLLELQRKWGYELHVLHFNHQLRPESQEEANFVKSIADQHQLPFHLRTASHLCTLDSGIQGHARAWRLEESQLLLKTINADHIATAHHADDQAETFLLKFLRGCHVSHLQGMSWKSSVFIRPLLHCSKKELQDYLTSKSHSWMEDASNQKPCYLRNRVRLELIPLMQELARGALYSHIEDMTEQSQQLQSWVKQSTTDFEQDSKEGHGDSLQQLECTQLQAQPEFLQHSFLHQFLYKETGQSVSYETISHLLTLIQKPTWKWQLSAQWTLCCKRGVMQVQETE